MKKKIVAFTGLPMAGKSTAREMLEVLLDEHEIAHEYVHFGATEEVERRNEAKEWDDNQLSWTMAQKEQYVRELWRQENGMGVMAIKMLSKIRSIIDAEKVVVIDNMYSDEERLVMFDEFGDEALLVVATVADWEVRVKRGRSRSYRPLTEEELSTRDKAEVYNLNKAPTIALAHYTLLNNSNNPEDLKTDIKNRILKEII